MTSVVPLKLLSQTEHPDIALLVERGRRLHPASLDGAFEERCLAGA